jgi:hypothetical protein
MCSRPPVPDPVKRLLRQEAGFGCCKCGYPIYQYHHIIPYEVEAHFRPSDMMVLCPNCHTSATNGSLDVDEQRQYKASPYNIRHKRAQGSLIVKQRALAVRLGTVQLEGNGTLIQVGNQPLLGLNVSRDGRLELSIELFDQDDNLLGRIDKNEWITGDAFPWDLEYGERWLRIRSKQRGIGLFIDARHHPMLVQGTLWFNKQRFDLTKDSVRLNGGAMSAQGGVTVSDLSIIGGSLLAIPDYPGLSLVPSSGLNQTPSGHESDTGVRRGKKLGTRRLASQMPQLRKSRSKRHKK